jgi:hypothetical protein
MALTLSLSYTERNDNKILTITDTTSNWGVGGNIGVGDVTTMTLNIDVTTSNGTSTAYDPINVITLLSLGVGSVQADLVIPITAVSLKVGGVALGTVADDLPDGIWGFTYVVASTVPVTSAILLDEHLIDGVVRTQVYELLRKMNNAYEWDGCMDEGVLNVIFAKTYLDAMNVLDVSARRTAVTDQLYTLERIITNIESYDI